MQYVPRLYLIFPLNKKIVKANGVVTKTAVMGAAYNLLLYMLASHVSSLSLSLNPLPFVKRVAYMLPEET